MQISHENDTTTNESTLIEDQKLMEGLVQQNALALEQLVRRFRYVLKAVIMQVIHDESEADDVLQEVFLQVWERAATYSAQKGKLVSWLATLARRRAIDRLRQHNAYRRATDRYQTMCNPADQETRHSVEHEAHCEDLKELLDQHLKALPPYQREVICMAYYECKTQREIAFLTGAPLGTVKTRIELGMRKLAFSIGGLKEKIV